MESRHSNQLTPKDSGQGLEEVGVREVWNTFDRWMLDQSYSRATCKGYMARVQQCHRWLRHNDHPGIHVATPETLRAWWDTVAPSPANRSHARSALVSFFRCVNEAGWRPDNPAETLPKLKLPKRLPRPVGEDARVALFAEAEAAGPMVDAMVHLFTFCGLRNAELRNLTWADIAGPWIHVTGKGSRERTVPIPPPAMLAVVRWRNQSTSAQWVFPSKRNPDRPMPASSIWDIFKELSAAAGGDRIKPHALRHTYATELLDVSHDITVVQLGLGHSTPDTSMIYAKVNPRRLEESSQTLFER
jgi:site-specific recombinase XerD